jgi:hypothetical protein
MKYYMKRQIVTFLQIMSEVLFISKQLESFRINRLLDFVHRPVFKNFLILHDGQSPKAY